MSTPHELTISRVVPATPEQLWKAWTTPDLLMQWFCPKPWKVIECDIELRPGGTFRTVMQSPDGHNMPAEAGCFLEVVPNRRLVFTDALGPGFRPKAEAFMTAVVTFEPVAGGTRYTARALHKSAEDKAKHEAMGFEPGWNAALDQLVELARTL